MVPGPVANAILHSATMQLQKTSQLFTGKNLVMGKFSEELFKQLQQTSSQQSQNLTAQVGARPITFIPSAGDSSAYACAKSSTSKRADKKKKTPGTGGTTLPRIAPKR